MKHAQRPHKGKPRPFLDAIMHITKLQEKHARTVIAIGGAYIGKYRCKDPERTVKAGDMLAAYWRFPPRQHAVSYDPAWILAESDQLLITNKPRGYPTQGRRDADYMAFYELLKQHNQGYIGLHHRLDQDTSGLLLFTRDQSRNKPLADAFQNKQIHKTYYAILNGTWPDGEDQITVDAPIGTQQTKQGTRHSVRKDGKPAQSHFTLIAQSDNLILAQVQPVTGRTHQIRVHAQHLGNPLHGDWLYAETGEPPFMLHCGRLQWRDVPGLQDGDWFAPAPQDWQARLPEPLQAALAAISNEKPAEQHSHSAGS